MTKTKGTAEPKKAPQVFLYECIEPCQLRDVKDNIIDCHGLRSPDGYERIGTVIRTNRPLAPEMLGEKTARYRALHPNRQPTARFIRRTTDRALAASVAVSLDASYYEEAGNER